jgi:hypothetical protein
MLITAPEGSLKRFTENIFGLVSKFIDASKNRIDIFQWCGSGFNLGPADPAREGGRGGAVIEVKYEV